MMIYLFEPWKICRTENIKETKDILSTVFELMVKSLEIKYRRVFHLKRYWNVFGEFWRKNLNLVKKIMKVIKPSYIRFSRQIYLKFSHRRINFRSDQFWIGSVESFNFNVCNNNAKNTKGWILVQHFHFKLSKFCEEVYWLVSTKKTKRFFRSF